MKALALDLLQYVIAVLTSWKILVGTLAGWLVFTVGLRFKPFGNRTVLVWLGLFLVAAPFPKWRELRQAIAEQHTATRSMEVERDSLRDTLTAIKNARPVSSEQPDKHRAVRARLAFFARQADTLMTGQARTFAMRPEEVAEWTKGVRSYLNTLEPYYALTFDAAVDPDDENTYSGTTSIALSRRRAVLIKFLEELRRP